MTFYLFTDLDDTLFQSRRKCSPNEPLSVGAVNKEGIPSSFLLPYQEAFLALAKENMRVVPVTGRNLESFQRVKLNFKYGAILNYGGTILTPAGEIDKDWDKKSKNDLEKYQEPLKETRKFILEIVRQNVLTSVVRAIEDPENKLTFYILVKNLDQHKEHLEIIYKNLKENFASSLPCPPWRIHYNDNNLAFIPNCLNKAGGLKYYLDNYIKEKDKPFVSIGTGDSLEDLSFINLCQYALIPSDSQISQNRLKKCEAK